MRLGLPSLAAVVLAGLAAAAPVLAQQHAGYEKLGQVNFANTCSPAVQADLNRAVALLHSFWWGVTIKARLSGIVKRTPKSPPISETCTVCQ